MALTNAQLSADIATLLASVSDWQDAYSAWLAGTPSGGPNNDGRYPLTNALGAVYLVLCPAALASTVEGPAADTIENANLAELYRNAAEAAATQAASHREFAEASRDAAQAARDLSLTYRDDTEGLHANVVYWAGLIAANTTTTADNTDLVIGLAANAANSAADAATSAFSAANSAALAATFDPDLFDLKTDPLASSRLTGMIDPARIPVVLSQYPVVSSGGIADLDSGQQTGIGPGTIVATTDGKRWAYTGTGSKTSEASYIEQGDVTPVWGAVADKPTNFQSNIAMVSGLQTVLDSKLATVSLTWANVADKPSTFTPATHVHAISDTTGLQAALDAKLPSASLTWSNVTDKPSTFSPSTHAHAISDTTGLQSALDAKLPSVSLTWSNVADKPSTFTPATHTHAISDTTGLQTALDAKLASSAFIWSGLGSKPTTLSGYGITDALPSSSYTAADVLSKIITVDGAGSGLDADLLDGYNSSEFARINNHVTFADVTASRLFMGDNYTQSILNPSFDQVGYFGASTTTLGGIITDRLAFTPPTTAAWSTDGTTFSAITIPTVIFKGMISNQWSGFNIPSTVQKVRFTWSPIGYIFIDHFVAACSTNGNSIRFIFEKSPDGTTWLPYYTSGWGSTWPGYISHKMTGTPDGSHQHFRITIERTATNGNDVNIGGLSLMTNYGGSSPLYTWDASKIVTFAATPTVNGSGVWHSGNDGVGSGLDAGLLIGREAQESAAPNSIAARNSGGYLTANWFDANGGGLYSSSTGVHFNVGAQNWGASLETNSTNVHLALRTAGGATRGFLYADNGNSVGLLDSGGNWNFQVRPTGASYLRVDNVLRGVFHSGDNVGFDNTRYGLTGVYDPAQTQAIWAMGSAYKLPIGGASNNYGNHYGLAWSYDPDYGGAGNNPQSKAGLGHQLLVQWGGSTMSAIGNGIWTNSFIECAGNGGWTIGSKGDRNRIDYDGSKFRLLTAANQNASLEALSITAHGTLTVGGLSTFGGGSQFSGGVYCDNWWRSTGATGWYNATYGTGIFSTQAGEVRTYNGSNFHSEGSLSTAGNLTAAGNLTVAGSSHFNGTVHLVVGTWHNSSEGQGRCHFAANSHSFYRSAEAHIFYNAANSTVATLDASGNLTVPGDMYAKGVRQPVFTSSTGAPSGGVDGDIHITY